MNGNAGTGRALERLWALGSPAALRARAARSAGAAALPANTHIHLPPNFSAFASVREALDQAAAEGIAVVGASNYYDYTIYAEFARLAAERGIAALFGTEIIAMDESLRRAGVLVNDPGNPGKFYLCGKGITAFAEPSREARRLLGVIRDGDGARIRAMIALVEESFARGGLPTGMDEERVAALVERRHDAPRDTIYLQERHVALAFQEALFARVNPAERAAVLARVFGGAATADPEDAAGVGEEIRARLMKASKPAYVAEKFVDFRAARRLVLELGGIPCYPTLADGAEPLCAFEAPVVRLIEQIRARGIHAAEFIPVRNRPAVLCEYATALRGAGFVLTAGTEHNTLASLPLAPSCRGGAIPEPLRGIFWEGACVVAAHQFLTLGGKCGFVDRDGRPHPGYRDDEERIAAFAALGAAVIERYREVYPRHSTSRSRSPASPCAQEERTP